MTVSYTLEVSNAGLCGFAKLLLRWRGSIYKLMLKEMIMFIGLYYNLSIIYRYALSADGRIIFEKISIYCKAFSNLIPISFVLGFYVAIVVHRWWEQVLSVPSPDKFALLVSTYIHGSDERSRIIRRTLIRYVNLTIVMTFQLISTAVKKRFPTIDHIQEAAVHDVSFPTTATPPTAAKSLFKVTRSLSQNEQKVTFIRNRPASEECQFFLYQVVMQLSKVVVSNYHTLPLDLSKHRVVNNLAFIQRWHSAGFVWSFATKWWAGEFAYF
ncbi:Bestrophin-2 [Nymphon striatum]|nr:Bestrophin-2 [Nymphon striatum]